MQDRISFKAHPMPSPQGARRRRSCLLFVTTLCLLLILSASERRKRRNRYYLTRSALPPNHRVGTAWQILYHSQENKAFKYAMTAECIIKTKKKNTTKTKTEPKLSPRAIMLHPTPECLRPICATPYHTSAQSWQRASSRPHRRCRHPAET
jgi:hypothetical protein